MSHYLDRLRDINYENAPPPGAVITAKSPSDSFGSSEGSRIPDAAPADLADGWRRQLATDTWHRDWSATWQRGSATVTATQLPAVVDELVAAWNGCTGDHRTAAEYLAHLSPVDHQDREIMCRGWLALYCWTLFHPEAES
jgi:hypothetical protein